MNVKEYAEYLKTLTTHEEVVEEGWRLLDEGGLDALAKLSMLPDLRSAEEQDAAFRCDPLAGYMPGKCYKPAVFAGMCPEHHLMRFLRLVAESFSPDQF